MMMASHTTNNSSIMSLELKEFSLIKIPSDATANLLHLITLDILGKQSASVICINNSGHSVILNDSGNDHSVCFHLHKLSEQNLI